MTPDDVARLAERLLERLTGADVRYDVMTAALIESRILPQPPFACRGEHLDLWQQQVNSIIDDAFARLRTNMFFETLVWMAANAALTEGTRPAPAEHLSDEALGQYRDCCSDSSASHITDYATYARYHAHLGTCDLCMQRLKQRRNDP